MCFDVSKVKVDLDDNYAFYVFDNGEVLELSLTYSIVNHFGEYVEEFDYLEKMENGYDIEDVDKYIEKIEEYIQKHYPFK